MNENSNAELIAMEFFSSFSTLAGRYDAFILDLWGVIHDGTVPYPGAIECLKRLKGAGGKVVLLSNAPRRAATAAEGLLRMGVTAEYYDALITSGETAYKTLSGENAHYFRPAGNRYIYIGLEKDRRILDGLSYHETNNPADAHFLLLSHSYYDNQPEAELGPLLARCLTAKLPALCVNPDTEVVRQSGERVYCAGVLAADYAAKGGRVVYFGKPHPIVYEAALESLKAVDPQRILAVGDNLATDILGAKNNRLKSAFVTGGVFAAELGVSGDAAYEANCAALFARTGITPDYVLGAFSG